MPEYQFISESYAAFGRGIAVTLSVTVLTIVCGTIIGVIVAVVGLYVKAARPIVRVYVEVLLGLPVLVLLVYLYYVLPMVSHTFTYPAYVVGVVGLSLSLSAFVAEIVEGGIRSVPKGQVEAAYILGVRRLQAVRYIVLPQAVKTMWPALVVQYITAYKFSTLVSVIGVEDVLHVGSQVVAQTYRVIEVYTLIAIFFVVTVLPLNMLARRFARTKTSEVIMQL